MKVRFGFRFLREVGVVYYDRLEKRTQEGGKIYGVRVALHRAGNTEEASCYVTENRAEIERLLTLLHRNAVTPCTLEEIIDMQVF